MKASEVLQQYQAGKRDFKHVNLRGQSFRKANLAGANFSYADIRGTNFTEANLTGAKFTKAKAGLQKRWAITLLIFALVLIALSALFTTFASVLVAFSVSDYTLENISQIVSGCVALVTLGSCYFFFFRQGINSGGSIVITLALAIATSIVLNAVLDVALYAALSITLGDLFPDQIFLIGFIAPITIAVSVLPTAIFTISLIGSVSVVFYATLYLVISTLLYAALYLDGSLDTPRIAVAGTFSLVTLSLNTYLAYRAYRGDERDAWIRGIGIAVAATGGTNFFGANLTEADFNQATLKNTNFRNATLTRTCFRDVKKLDFARVGNTILTATPVRKLLVDGKGDKQDYTRANLWGANLDGATLEAAIFKYADLSEATLVGANLQSANLTEAQAVGTNFTQAKLTGACLEAWNIDSTTILAEIDCLWIYLAEKEQKNSSQWGERRPSSGNFKPGEFTKLFTEILNTVDLIFENGVDWKAFLTAFDQVRIENEDLNLTIRSIENVEDGTIVIKVNVPPDADKEKIHSTFNQNYQLALEAVKKEYEAMLAGKDREIAIYRQESARIERIVSSFASNQPNFINNNKAMNNSEDKSQNIDVRDLNLNAENSMVSVVNLGDLSGKVSNNINKLPETTSDAPGIKELLTQLQTAIETETELADKSKTKALKQVQKLATAGENPQANQDDADDSLTMLKGIVSGVKETAKLVTTCQEIIPLLTGLFGL